VIPTYDHPDFDPSTEALAFYDPDPPPESAEAKQRQEDCAAQLWWDDYAEWLQFYEGSEGALHLPPREQMYVDWGEESGFFAWQERHDQSQIWTHFAAESFLLHGVPVPTEKDEFYQGSKGAFE
jgi:hypothetical protein